MDELEEIKEIFFSECTEQLAVLEAGLLAASSGDAHGADVNAMFRAVHSMKGGAGAFEMTDIVRFAHVFENTMDEIRAGRLEMTPQVVAVLLRSADVLADLIAAARSGDPVAADRIDAVDLEMRSLNGTPSAQPLQTAQDIDLDALFAFQPIAAADENVPDGQTSQGQFPAEAILAEATWLVVFKPAASLYRNAGEPLLLLRELATLGTMDVRLVIGDLPSLDQMRADLPCLAWEISLTTAAGEADIRAVFDFVEDDCALSIRADTASPQPGAVVLPAPAQMPDPAADRGSDLVSDLVSDRADTPVRVPEPANDAAASRSPARDAGAQPATIRVDLDRLDRLINLLGELVINQAMLAERVAEAGLGKARAVEGCLAELEQLTREIQEGVMAVRAQPVRTVFQRMTRVAREAAAISNKQVQLLFDGETTEVDKTIIERLSDPLTHMIRNAIDHGLEPAATRQAAGKPELGTIRLRAGHRSGRVVIDISDDGAGINRAKVRGIAIERGLIPADAQLSDEDTDGLLFLPGFSTADTISAISGRGVGMDVVKQSISDMGGRITIQSTRGRGSTFSMSLPLTLAVLDGIVLIVAGQTLVVPITAVVESLQIIPASVRAVGPDAQVYCIRDTYLPLTHIARTLGFDGACAPGGVGLLLEAENGRRIVVVADEIQGQRQVVIKSLEANYQQVPGIAAATILGDGRVALIVDVEKLISMGDGAFEPSQRQRQVA